MNARFANGSVVALGAALLALVATPAGAQSTGPRVTVDQINCQPIDYSGSDINHVESTQMTCLDVQDGIEFDVHSLGPNNWLAVWQP